MKHKTRETLKGVGAFVALVIGVPVFFFGCFKLFAYADCQTAVNGLDFYEQCEADEDCRLTAQERSLKQAYTRMRIKSCPKD